MKLISYFKKNIVLGIFVFVELVVLLGTLLGGKGEKYVLDIPYMDIIGTTIPDDRGGWYIDESFPCEESGLFDYSADIKLKRGTYDITVRYETDTDTNTSMVAATTNTYGALRTDNTPLPSKTTQITYTTYLLEDVEDFQVQTFYGGSGYLIVKGFTITETHAYLRIMLCMEVLAALLLNVGYICKKKGLLVKASNEQLAIGISLIGIALLASYPITSGYMMLSHDIGFHLLRIDGLKEGLLAGQFPVKMQPNWLYGYGYPTSVYYGDLCLYFPALLRVIGFSVQTAYDCLVLALNAATVGIAYWCFHKFWKDKPIALVGAFLYTMAPYRFTDIYMRGAIGESLAITFLPLLAYGICAAITQDITEKSYKKLWIPMVIGFTGVIQSHLLTCIMCAEFIILICLIKIKTVLQKERFLVLFKTVVYTSLLNLGFIIPCATSMKLIDVTQPYRTSIRIQDGGAQLSQLFNIFYICRGDGYGAAHGVSGESAEGIGFTLLIGLMIFLLAWIFNRDNKEQDINIKRGKYFFAICLLAIFMSTVYFPWDYLSTILGSNSMWIANIQFATRYLEIADLLAVITTCSGLYYFKKHMKREYYLIAVMTCILLGTISGVYMLNDRTNNSEATYMYDIDKLGRTDHNVKEYLVYGTDIETLVANTVIPSEQVQINSYQKNATTIHMQCDNAASNEGYVEVPLLYYEQYVAKDSEGTVLSLCAGENNVLRVIVPGKYNGHITISYVQPVIWRIAELISLLTLFIMFGYYGYSYKKHVKSKKKGTIDHE